MICNHTSGLFRTLLGFQEKMIYALKTEKNNDFCICSILEQFEEPKSQIEFGFIGGHEGNIQEVMCRKNDVYTSSTPLVLSSEYLMPNFLEPKKKMNFLEMLTKCLLKSLRDEGFTSR